MYYFSVLTFGTVLISCLLSIKGKIYVLLFKSVTPEDIAEIKFTAEKASSTAKLTVKGKVYFQHAFPIAWYLWHDMLSNIGYNNIFRSAHHNIRVCNKFNEFTSTH